MCIQVDAKREAHGEQKAARVFGVVCLSGGSVSHRGQACWHVLPSAMQREQPISLVRSLSASIASISIELTGVGFAIRRGEATGFSFQILSMVGTQMLSLMSAG